MRPRSGPRRRTHLDDPPEYNRDLDSIFNDNADLEEAPDVIKSKKDERTLARNFRSILPVRVIGGSCIMSLPKGLRIPLDIKAGDRLLVELDTANQSIVIKKDSEGNRKHALREIDNLKQIWKLCLYLKRSETLGDAVWCRRAEKTLLAIVKHLKGEVLDKAEDDEGEDL